MWSQLEPSLSAIPQRALEYKSQHRLSPTLRMTAFCYAHVSCWLGVAHIVVGLVLANLPVVACDVQQKVTLQKRGQL